MQTSGTRWKLGPHLAAGGLMVCLAVVGAVLYGLFGPPPPGQAGENIKPTGPIAQGPSEPVGPTTPVLDPRPEDPKPVEPNVSPPIEPPKFVPQPVFPEPAAPPVELPSPQEPIVPPAPPGQPPVVEPEPPATPPMAVPERGEFLAAVKSVRLAMADRDLTAARRHLATATKEAQTDQDRAEVERLETMAGYLDEFWKVVRSGMARLSRVGDLPIGDRIVRVVEASADELTIHDRGRNRTFRRENMPGGLAYIIARREMADVLVNKLILGTFLVLDREGDRDVARRLWREAQSAGQNVSSLLPELDVLPARPPRKSNGR
ncbi:MAG: hypothetical protein JW818_07820 [Pirellulales bacterium]|nr:hypothetical protein [Pirellulales bacterium]